MLKGLIVGLLLHSLLLNDMFVFIKNVNFCNFVDENSLYATSKALMNVKNKSWGWLCALHGFMRIIIHLMIPVFRNGVLSKVLALQFFPKYHPQTSFKYKLSHITDKGTAEISWQFSKFLMSKFSRFFSYNYC